MTCSVCDHGPPSGPAAEISNACAEAHKTLSTWQVRGPSVGDTCRMTAPLPEPDPIINPNEPVPDDPAELLPDAPEPLPPPPIEATPDDPGGDPGGVPEPA